MTTSAQLKRLEALEAAARVRKIDDIVNGEFSELRPLALKYAEDLNVSVDAVLAEAAASLRRIEEVGEDRWYAEIAAECGMTAGEFRHDIERGAFDRKWEEYKVWDRERRERAIHWRAGVAYYGRGERV